MSQIVSQRFMRNGVLICETNDPAGSTLRDDGLFPDTEYIYHLVNVDVMGHQSSKARAVARTLAADPEDQDKGGAEGPGEPCTERSEDV